MEPKILNLRRIRTKSETFYFTLLILFSFFVWYWLCFSIFRQFTAPVNDNYEQACYIEDFSSDHVTSVDPDSLLPGEECMKWSDLSDDQQKEVSRARESFGYRITASLTTPVLFFLFFGFSLFLHYLSIAYIRMNAVKVGPEQFPEIWQAREEIAKSLNITKSPDVFILMGNGVLNAFATKLIIRKFVVLYSDLAEALVYEGDQRQLHAVIAHEMGHHVLGHTKLVWEWFFMPISFIPFVLLPLNRAREYSSDRCMKAVMGENASCERALVKLAAGKMYGSRVNIESYMRQRYDEGGFFAWAAEKLSTHPHLPNRIAAIYKFEL